MWCSMISVYSIWSSDTMAPPSRGPDLAVSIDLFAIKHLTPLSGAQTIARNIMSWEVPEEKWVRTIYWTGIFLEWLRKLTMELRLIGVFTLIRTVDLLNTITRVTTCVSSSVVTSILRVEDRTYSTTSALLDREGHILAQCKAVEPSFCRDRSVSLKRRTLKASINIAKYYISLYVVPLQEEAVRRCDRQNALAAKMAFLYWGQQHRTQDEKPISRRQKICSLVVKDHPKCWVTLLIL